MACPVLYIHTVELQNKLAILADAAKYDASLEGEPGTGIKMATWFTRVGVIADSNGM